MSFSRHVVTASILVMLSLCSCSALSGKAIQVEELLLTDDVVLALRYSPESYDAETNTKSGFVVLVKADGSLQGSDVGYMSSGSVVWSKEGLWWGGPSDEYHLSQKGVSQKSRNDKRYTETSRFSLDEGKRSVAIYNAGISDDGYSSVVVSFDGNEKLSSKSITGFYDGRLAKCGDKIFGVTDAIDLSSEENKSFNRVSNTHVLKQIYPNSEDNSSEQSIVFEYDSNIDHYSENMDPAPCIDGKVYSLAAKVSAAQDNSWSASGLVLRIWDTHAGSYQELPLRLDDGNGNVSETDFGYDGLLDSRNGYLNIAEKTFTWLSTTDWVVRSVDLDTGVVRNLRKIEVSDPEAISFELLTEKSIFVVQQLQDFVKFSRFELNTGNETNVIEIRDTERLNPREMSFNNIYGFAVNPVWIEEQERS